MLWYNPFVSMFREDLRSTFWAGRTTMICLVLVVQLAGCLEAKRKAPDVHAVEIVGRS